jgi:hypothetical protein
MMVKIKKVSFLIPFCDSPVITFYFLVLETNDLFFLINRATSLMLQIRILLEEHL